MNSRWFGNSRDDEPRGDRGRMPESNFGGDYARDPHRGGLGDDYARDTYREGLGGDYGRDDWWNDRPERSSVWRSLHDDAQRASESRRSYRGVGPKNYRRGDDRIREDVCELLTESHDVDASDISVLVDGGEVTLTGSVQDRRDKRVAEDLALRCSGVRDVHNRLNVGTNANIAIGKSSE